MVNRRFGGVARLYGPEAYARLHGAHIAVVGIGGVGSWTAEALARCGVGTLTLIDLDHIAESNVNRQVHALSDTLGQAKVDAMAARVIQINPRCRVICVDDFVTPDNVTQHLTASYDAVVDCTDHIAAKVAMVLHARARAVPLWVCGGAGGKTDPLTLRVSDLSQVHHDALLAKLRTKLRREAGYPNGAARQGGRMVTQVPKMHVTALWFDQPTLRPPIWEGPAAVVGQIEPIEPLGVGSGLSCAGYGSIVTLTATMGLVAADLVLRSLLTAAKKTSA
jgi:tRNA A37 threonylcarbamoyladenosine dehydratase